MANLATRPGAKLSDVNDSSKWVCCMERAKSEKSAFPTLSFQDIKLSKDDTESHNDELLKLNVSDNEWIYKQLSHLSHENYSVISSKNRTKIGNRYSFSNYVIDPNKYRFRKVLRILSLVFLFIRNLQRKIGMSNSVVKIAIKVPEQFFVIIGTL